MKPMILDVSKLRGQYYDGASDVSGRISRLQARVRGIEKRALLVHCDAHRLNLSVQDSMEGVPPVKNFISITKDVINFVRDSPKRLAQFRDFQTAVIGGDEEESPALVSFYPTKWCMRVRALKSLYSRTNYKAALQFFEARSTDREVDNSMSAMANGFLRYLETFEYYFLLTLVMKLFDRIEILNKELQKADLCLHDSHRKVEAVTNNLEQSRDSKFDVIWDKAISGAMELELEEPELPRNGKFQEVWRRVSMNLIHFNPQRSITEKCIMKSTA